jgi:hypothetical protein
MRKQPAGTCFWPAPFGLLAEGETWAVGLRIRFEIDDWQQLNLVKLHLSVRDTSEGPPERSMQKKAIEVNGASADRFTLRNAENGNGGVLTRKR